jgi:phosphate transport system substrate-binding protein
MTATRRIPFALAVALAAAGCGRLERPLGQTTGRGIAAEVTRIRIGGSTALLPVATEAANLYMKAHQKVAIFVVPGGSRQGLADVAAGAMEIADSDLFASGPVAAQLEDHRVAVVGMAAMADAALYNDAISSLSRTQLQGIFGGRIHNWSEVGGADLPMTVIDRPSTSGTRALFQSLALGGSPIATDLPERSSSGQLQITMLAQPGTVSYLALSFQHPQLKIFGYEGQSATRESIEDGRYPLWNYWHMYTKGQAQGEVKAFIEFVLSDEFQAKVLPRFEYIPVQRMKVSRDHD